MRKFVQSPDPAQDSCSGLATLRPHRKVNRVWEQTPERLGRCGHTGAVPGKGDGGTIKIVRKRHLLDGIGEVSGKTEFFSNNVFFCVSSCLFNLVTLVSCIQGQLE